MRGILIFLSSLFLIFWILEKSGTLAMVPYTTREGTIQVQKSRIEWHPEKIPLFFQKLFPKTGSGLSRTRSEGSSKTKKAKGPFQKLILKNGALLQGKVTQKTDEGIVFETEEGKIFFRQDEVASLTEK